MKADEILRRLVEWFDNGPIRDIQTRNDIVDDARAYLAREQGPVAEGFVVMWVEGDGGWTFESCYESDVQSVKVRIPVPAHIVNPPVVDAEVIE